MDEKGAMGMEEETELVGVSACGRGLRDRRCQYG